MKRVFIGFVSGFFVQYAIAGENCTALQANIHMPSGAYVFKQRAFENSQDLAIIDPQAQVRRVTFGRGDSSKNCYFQPIAFVQGGQDDNRWGWHMLWAEPVGLYYARMDGEAWVSSNPKCLTKLVAINPQFKLNGQTIIVTWQQVENAVTSNMQALSSDEGRSWNIVSIP